MQITIESAIRFYLSKPRGEQDKDTALRLLASSLKYIECLERNQSARSTIKLTE